MRINDPDAYQIETDIDVIAGLLDLAGSRVLELGCGAAGSTRELVERLRPAEVIATEVDRAQLDKNASPIGSTYCARRVRTTMLDCTG